MFRDQQRGGLLHDSLDEGQGGEGQAGGLLVALVICSQAATHGQPYRAQCLSGTSRKLVQCCGMPLTSQALAELGGDLQRGQYQV